MAREQPDEYGKTRFLSLDLLYNGGVGWSWYVVILTIHFPPRQASLAFWKFQFILFGFEITLSLKYAEPFYLEI